ncbi:MAG: hypothetical protein ABIG87_03220 [Patescibacteria group bacterium]
MAKKQSSKKGLPVKDYFAMVAKCLPHDSPLFCSLYGDVQVEGVNGEYVANAVLFNIKAMVKEKIWLYEGAQKMHDFLSKY